MRTIIVVSRCCRRYSGSPETGEFAFKGFYAGEEIERLILLAPTTVQWVKGEDYLLYVKVLLIEKNQLMGEALKVRKLTEVMMLD